MEVGGKFYITDYSIYSVLLDVQWLLVISIIVSYAYTYTVRYTFGTFLKNFSILIDNWKCFVNFAREIDLKPGTQTCSQRDSIG